jgi:sodium/proline symporter
MIITFILFLMSFMLIGVYAARKAKPDKKDYLLAGRGVNPWNMALSAVSTNNSGFMFIGLIGATYSAGISSAWIMVGWIAGDFLAWLWVHRALREISESNDSTTIPEFLSKNSNGHSSRPIRIFAAFITLIFLGTYAAAQLHAGSKAIHVIFGFEMYVGIIVGGLVVLLYSFSGGIRASIYTDSVQAILMLVSMLTLVVVALYQLGGFSGLFAKLAAIDPKLVSWNPAGLQFGIALYILSWFFAGLGVTGQPHIMVRAMTIENAVGVRKARNIYFVWYVIFTVSAILVGLACRVLLPGISGHPELALPQISTELLPGIVTGMVLAGLISATMSTADSQILSCSAAISQDMLPSRGHSYRFAKGATLAVMVLVMGIALLAHSSVFDLVTISWSVLACSLGPLMLARTLRLDIPNGVALSMMALGLGTMLVWRHVLHLQSSIFDALPGMCAGLLPLFIYVVFQKAQGNKVRL